MGSIDRNERTGEYEAAILYALETMQAGVFTSMPGIINTFDPETQTATVQPALKFRMQNPEDGSFTWIQLPLLLDCPVFFPSGGGFTLTFPITPGDECLVAFSCRCIDNWWDQGGIQEQAEFRMHDLSDGFAFVGIRSKPRFLTGVSSNSVQLRSDDGLAYVQIDPNHKIRLSAVDVVVHASHSYQWDINGYGQKWTATGGVNYTLDNYTLTAVVTTVNHSIAPPDAS